MRRRGLRRSFTGSVFTRRKPGVCPRSAVWPAARQALRQQPGAVCCFAPGNRRSHVGAGRSEARRKTLRSGQRRRAHPDHRRGPVQGQSRGRGDFRRPGGQHQRSYPPARLGQRRAGDPRQFPGCRPEPRRRGDAVLGHRRQRDAAPQPGKVPEERLPRGFA